MIGFGSSSKRFCKKLLLSSKFSLEFKQSISIFAMPFSTIMECIHSATDTAFGQDRDVGWMDNKIYKLAISSDKTVIGDGLNIHEALCGCRVLFFFTHLLTSIHISKLLKKKVTA